MRASKQLSDLSGAEQVAVNGETTFVDESALVCPCQRKCTDILGFDSSGDQLVFGVRWTPLDFVRQAVRAAHPMYIFSGLFDEVRSAIHDVASLHPAQIILRRKRWLHKWRPGRCRQEVEDGGLFREVGDP